MLMKQVKLREDNGAMMDCWIDMEHAIRGHRFDLNLGDCHRSPVVTVTQVWDLIVRDRDEIQERETNRRSFGGSIK